MENGPPNTKFFKTLRLRLCNSCYICMSDYKSPIGNLNLTLTKREKFFVNGKKLKKTLTNSSKKICICVKR